MRPIEIFCTFLVIAALSVLIHSEPALAGNKFETIGGGVAGKTAIKMTYLRPISAGFGVFFLIGAILSATKYGHKSASSPNYSLWKQSTVILVLFSLLAFSVALFA